MKRVKPRRSSDRRRRAAPEAALARFLFELGQLKHVQRSGWWLAGIRQAESVAEHSFRAAAIAYVVAAAVGADPSRAALQALFHDASESRLNDLHRLAKRYWGTDGVEAAALAAQSSALPAAVAAALGRLHAERRERRTLEARIAKDADLLECLLQACEYRRLGFPVERWIRSSLRDLKIPFCRRLARAVLREPPESWQDASR
jgi:putative hydrolase of HD superfamily